MDKKETPTWHRHSHFWERGFGRRQFMRTVAGAAGLGLVSGLSLPSKALAQAGSGVPKPIPGGVSPLGIPIHHFPLPTPGTPLSQLTEPSEITDFNGFIGGTRIRGGGIGTGFNQPLAFQTDMGFMQGEFVGEDGEHHNGTFVFI